MAPNYRVLENPITLWSHKAMRVMGKLASQWATDPSSRPKDAREEAGGRVLVLSADAFLEFLANLDGDDSLGEQDITVRRGISEVEIILRQEGRAALLMPEPEAIEEQKLAAENPSLRPALQVPRLYMDLESNPRWIPESFLDTPPLPDSECSIQVIKLEDADPFDNFIHPYMGAYICAQCT